MASAPRTREPALTTVPRGPEGPAVATAVRPAVPRLIEEMIAAIRAEIPEYDRPLQGRFGENVRVGTTGSIDRFLAAIAGEEADERARGGFYVELGRNESR